MPQRSRSTFTLGLVAALALAAAGSPRRALAAPSPPAALTVAVNGPTSATISWTPDGARAAGYELVRDGLVVARAAAADALLMDAALAPDTEYCWTVGAIDAAGRASPLPAPVCARTSPAGTPSGPSQLRAAWAGEQDVALTWEPSPSKGVVYAVYRASGKRVGLTGRTRFMVFGVGARGERCYRVTALDADGRESPPSPPACVAGDEASPGAPGPGAVPSGQRRRGGAGPVARPPPGLRA